MKKQIVILCMVLLSGMAARAQDPMPDAELVEPPSRVEFRPDTLRRHMNPGFTLPD